MADPKAFAQRLEEMGDDDREHFRDVINRLSYCYADDTAQAVILYVHSAKPLIEALTLNCDDMEAFDIVRGAVGYFEFMNIKDAPPKEQFN